MEFESPQQPEKEKSNGIKIGDLIQFKKPPYLVKIIPEDEFGDLGNGRISKSVFINIFDAMSEEDKSEIRKINPNLNL